MLVVALPTVYILVAVFVSLQLSVVLNLIGQAAIKVRTVPQLAAVEPGTPAPPSCPTQNAVRLIFACICAGMGA